MSVCSVPISLYVWLYVAVTLFLSSLRSFNAQAAPCHCLHVPRLDHCPSACLFDNTSSSRLVACVVRQLQRSLAEGGGHKTPALLSLQRVQQNWLWQRLCGANISDNGLATLLQPCWQCKRTCQGILSTVLTWGCALVYVCMLAECTLLRSTPSLTSSMHSWQNNSIDAISDWHFLTKFSWAPPGSRPCALSWLVSMLPCQHFQSFQGLPVTVWLTKTTLL